MEIAKTSHTLDQPNICYTQFKLFQYRSWSHAIGVWVHSFVCMQNIGSKKALHANNQHIPTIISGIDEATPYECKVF